MRRVLLLCLGVVSCASPDLPRVDGVPEDPGNHLPPPLPMNTTPEAPVVPNESEPAAESTDDAQRSEVDAGAAGVAPVPTGTNPPPNTSTSAASSEADTTMADDTAAASSAPAADTAGDTEPAYGSADGGAPVPTCESDAGFDGGVSDAGTISELGDDCNGR